MKSTRRKFAAIAILAACLAAMPWVAHILSEPLIVTVVTRMMIYGLAAVSLDLILGIGGMASFGHAAYFGLGGYVVGILTFQAAADQRLFGNSSPARARHCWLGQPQFSSR